MADKHVYVRCPQCRRSRRLQLNLVFDHSEYVDENEKRGREGRADFKAIPEFVIPCWCVDCANYMGLKTDHMEVKNGTVKESK